MAMLMAINGNNNGNNNGHHANDKWAILAMIMAILAIIMATNNGHNGNIMARMALIREY